MPGKGSFIIQSKDIIKIIQNVRERGYVIFEIPQSGYKTFVQKLVICENGVEVYITI